MSDIRYNQWLHNSGTGGVSQDAGGNIGIGTTAPLIPVGAGNTAILNVGVVTCNSIEVTGNVSVGGTLTYQDVTNIDSVGLITARAGIIDSTLTAGRVVYVDSNKSLTDSGNLTFNGSDLLIDASTNAYKGVKFDNSFNLTFGSSSGSSPRLYLKGTSNSQSDSGDTFLATGTGGEQIFRSNTFTKFEVNADSTTAEALRITSAGKVGVGTAIPDETLELWKASGTNLVKISTQANSTIGLLIEKTGSTTQSWKIADGQTANGTLEIYDATESETRLAIDGSGRVIIGQHNHSGGGTLVVVGNSNTPNAYGCAAFCKIGANPTSGQTLAQLRFSAGSGGTNRAAEISVQADSNWNDGTNQESKMIFKVATSGGGNTAGSALMTLKGTGDVEINRGNLVIAATKGIDFSATTPDAANNANVAELLDDYEEGRHIITVTGSSSNPTVNVTHPNLWYVKVGSMVHMSGELRWTTSSHGSGTLRISLPFAAKNLGTGHSFQGTAQTWNIDWKHNQSSTDYILSEVSGNTSYMFIRCASNDNLLENALQLGSSVIGSANSGYGIELTVSLTYRAE